MLCYGEYQKTRKKGEEEKTLNCPIIWEMQTKKQTKEKKTKAGGIFKKVSTLGEVIHTEANFF